MSRTEHVRSRGRRWRWLFVGGGGGAVLAVGTALLGNIVGLRTAVRWTLVTCPVLLYETWFSYSRYVRQSASVPATAIRLPNAVTMVRGWLYAAVGGFVLFRPTPAVVWLPGLCYGIGVVLDQADGRIARRTDSESRLGEQLDVAFDTVGFLVAPAVAVAWGRLPAWYLFLPAAQYLFKLGREVRRRRGLTVNELEPDSRRRGLAGAQMAFLTAALLPVVPPEPLGVVAPAVLAPSLAIFLRDYLVVAGYYSPSTDR
jgi:CDP-diacylglycerol--glycerol-3-phosphate 3-phosphatidyltransferase